MSTQSLTVEQARTALADAEAAQREERRAELTTRLASVRAELRAERESFSKLERQVHNAQVDLNNVRSAILATSDALSRVQAAKPEIADHLPDDPEVVQWTRHCEQYEARLKELQAQRRALPNVERMRFDGVQLRDRIQQLEFAERDLLNQLNNALASTRVGGVFAPL